MARHKIKVDTAIKAAKPMPAMYRLNDDGDLDGRAFNRTTHRAKCRKMMQQWADYLDKLKASAEVVPLHSQLA